MITDYKTDETLCCSLIRFFQVTDQRRDRTKRGTTALEARDGDVDMPPDDWYDSPRYTCCDLAVNADLWYVFPMPLVQSLSFGDAVAEC